MKLNRGNNFLLGTEIYTVSVINMYHCPLYFSGFHGTTTTFGVLWLIIGAHFVVVTVGGLG